LERVGEIAKKGRGEETVRIDRDSADLSMGPGQIYLGPKEGE